MWEMESQRVAFGETLVELGKERSDIVVLSADLASSPKASMFAKEFPERFFNMGVAEQNMMGVAAGLAASGKIVFVTTFSVFASGRAYDQVRQSIAYPKLNVKIVASHGGITVGPDGATHQITEDIALMSVLPNMTVIVPADAVETKKAVRAAVQYNGPVYIRLGRANVPTITREEDKFKIGRATILREGDDVALIGTGIMVSQCLKAAEILSKKGIDAMVINMSTIKPLDEKTIIKAADRTGAIVTAEEHNVTMGMGTAIAMVLGEHRQVPMHLVGIPDVFGESGEPEELMKKYGLTVEDVVKAAEDVVARKGKKGKKYGLLRRGVIRIIHRRR
ncbi:MAG: transketolase family protein [Thermoplasmata archaeon]|nr:MAG: transketolase family protein [Thermoplasmata archaeon]